MELDYCSELELSFQMKVKVWRKTEEGQNPSCLKDSVNFLHSVTTWVPCNMLAVVALSPPCFIKFKVNTSVNQEILEHFSLPSFIEKLISFSSRTQPQCQDFDQMVWWPCCTVQVWPGGVPEKNPIIYRVLSDEHEKPKSKEWLKATIKANLGFNNTPAVPQANLLHVMSHWYSYSWKRIPKFLEYLN